jgi:hypothetical protein
MTYGNVKIICKNNGIFIDFQIKYGIISPRRPGSGVVSAEAQG